MDQVEKLEYVSQGGGGERRGEEVAHWQLNSGDLLNSCWHARHGGQYKAQTNSRGREGGRKRFNLHFMTGQFAVWFGSTCLQTKGDIIKCWDFCMGSAKLFKSIS